MAGGAGMMTSLQVRRWGHQALCREPGLPLGAAASNPPCSALTPAQVGRVQPPSEGLVPAWAGHMASPSGTPQPGLESPSRHAALGRATPSSLTSVGRRAQTLLSPMNLPGGRCLFRHTPTWLAGSAAPTPMESAGPQCTGWASGGQDPTHDTAWPLQPCCSLNTQAMAMGR